MNNTFYTATGDNIRIQNASTNVELRNNVLWDESGYDVYVANDSQAGFSSDYNDLHARPAPGESSTGPRTSPTSSTSRPMWRPRSALDRQQPSSTPTGSEPRFYNKALRRLPHFRPDRRPAASPAPPSMAAIRPGPGLPGLRPSSRAPTSTCSPTPPLKTARPVDREHRRRHVNRHQPSPAAFDGSIYFFAGRQSPGLRRPDDRSARRRLHAAPSSTRSTTPCSRSSLAAASAPLAEAAPDRGQITLTFLDGTRPSHRQLGLLAVASNITDRWELIGGRRTIPAGTHKSALPLPGRPLHRPEQR